MNKLKKAYFAWWCFWCIEWAFRLLDWVVEAVSWYAWWEEENPSYKEVSWGYTGHKEAVEVVYDPEIIDYINILSTFWRQIDPTDKWWQFADRWDHYTTAIYYTDEYQRKIAEASRRYLENSGKFDEKIVTDILPFTTFYKAEDYHQNYSDKQTCHYNAYKKWSWRTWYIEKTWWYDESSLISEEDYNRINNEIDK